MKYRHQDEFDKLHRCVIIVIEDDVPHARAFWLNLILFEKVESRFVDRFSAVWIMVLQEGITGCFHHLDANPSIIRNSNLPPWLCACPIPAAPHMGLLVAYSHAPRATRICFASSKEGG